jgi:hypothetical protein
LHGDVVYPGHSDLPAVPRGSLDDEWLPVIGQERLIVITRDQRIRYRPVEKRMWIEHRVRGFVLTGRQSQSTIQSVTVLEKHWSRIEAIVDVHPDGPWMCSVTAQGLRTIPLS